MNFEVNHLICLIFFSKYAAILLPFNLFKKQIYFFLPLFNNYLIYIFHFISIHFDHIFAKNQQNFYINSFLVL